MDDDILLNEQFYEAVKKASKLEMLPIDIKLKFYAYYKHATKGDKFRFNINDNQHNLIDSFKYNAWIQLKGISSKKAKKEYIKLVKQHINI